MAQYAFMEAAYPELPTARQCSATSIPGPSCQAEIGAACEGPRVVRRGCMPSWTLVRAGGLSEAPAAMVTKQADVTSCRECGEEHTQFGWPVACDNPAHRCQRLLVGGKQCTRTVEPGGRWCASHGKRWC